MLQNTRVTAFNIYELLRENQQGVPDYDQRRYYMLLAITHSPPQLKQMLWEETQFLQQNGKNLFGKKLQEHINDSFHSKKQILQILASRNNKILRPFRSDLPQAAKSFEEQLHQKFFLKRNIALTKNNRYHNDTQSGYKNDKYKPGNLVQQSSAISWFTSTSRIKIHLSLSKKFIFCKRNTGMFISRKIKTIYRKLETTDKRRNSISHRGIQITFSW